MSYGSPFSRPPINKTLTPGGWTIVKGSSPFALSAAEHVLDHVKSKFDVKLPRDVEFHLEEAGTQVVTGINVYISGRFDSPAAEVQAIVYNPVTAASGGVQVSKVYVKML
jgi:hypothetical protein